MSRRTILITLAVVLVVSVPSFANLALAAWGRAQNVYSVRAGCQRTGLRNAVLVNVTRAGAQANYLIATDPTQSRRTRHARAVESQTERTAALLLDSQTEAHDWRAFNAQVDRRAVRYGVNGHKPFHCNAAYPITGLIP